MSLLEVTLAAQRAPQVAVLDFGQTEAAERTVRQVLRLLAASASVKLLDREQSRAAARGAGYAGSLNMTTDDARDLGAALGCDFFMIGDAGVLRRTSFEKPLYFEAYTSILLISVRTGQLIYWDHFSFNGATAAEAEKLLSAEITQRAERSLLALVKAAREEPAQRVAEKRRAEEAALLIDNAPTEDGSATGGFQSPRPYRRLRPRYPATAARAEAKATIDVIVEIDASGAVTRVEVVRWGGFGLDEEVVETVKRMHFWPAMRDGAPVPVRSLLRYNFRPPPPG